MILFTCLCLLAISPAHAAELTPGVITHRANISAGGGISSGGAYILNGAIGLDRGDGARPSGGDYQIVSGVWNGPESPGSNTDAIYLPLLTK